MLSKPELKKDGRAHKKSGHISSLDFWYGMKVDLVGNVFLFDGGRDSLSKTGNVH